jgi:hypothetical protein
MFVMKLYSFLDEAVRLSCEAVIYSINEHSPDVLKAHAALALPLVFLAMHEVKGKRSFTNFIRYPKCMFTHSVVHMTDICS